MIPKNSIGVPLGEKTYALTGSGRVVAVATRIDNDPASERSDIYVLGPAGNRQGGIVVGR